MHGQNHIKTELSLLHIYCRFNTPTRARWSLIAFRRILTFGSNGKKNASRWNTGLVWRQMQTV